MNQRVPVWISSVPYPPFGYICVRIDSAPTIRGGRCAMIPLTITSHGGATALTTDVQGPDDIRPPVEETENISPDLATPVNLAATGPFSPLEEVREMKPFFFLDDVQNNPIKDFRPAPVGRIDQPDLVPVIEEETDAPDPKDSSAPES